MMNSRIYNNPYDENMMQTVTILGTEMPINEARATWYALSEVFGMSSTAGYWNLIPDEDQGNTMALLCPCPDCEIFA